MKKLLFPLTILFCFLFIPKTNALMSQTLVTSMDLSSTTISSPYSRFMTPSYFKNGQTDYNVIMNNDLSYCYFFASSYDSSVIRLFCADVPAKPRNDIYNTYFAYDTEFKYVTGQWTGSRWEIYYLSDGTPQIATKINNENFYSISAFFSSTGIYKNWNDNDLTYYNSDDSYAVTRFINVFIRDDTTYNNVSSFTFAQDKLSNRVQSFVMVFENSSNPTMSFSYEKGLIYYNNNIFTVPQTDNGIEETFFQTSSTRFPLLIQTNTNFSYPDYNSNTLSYLRLYFKNDEVGNTEGTYYFYRNLLDATTTPMTNEDVTFIVNEDLVVPEDPGEDPEHSGGGASIDDMNNNIMDSSPPDVTDYENLAGLLPPGPVDSILNLPLNVMLSISSALGSNCIPLRLPLPYVNQTLELACVNSIYAKINGLGVFLDWVGTITSAFILYAYFSYLYSWIESVVTLKNQRYKWGGI